MPRCEEPDLRLTRRRVEMTSSRNAAREAVHAALLCHGYYLPLIADTVAVAAIGALSDPSPALKDVLADAIFTELGNPSDWLGVDEKKVMAAVVDAIIAGA
jgi:hypothetical protein